MIGMDPHVYHHLGNPRVLCSDSPPFADGEALTNQGFSPILSSALGEAAHVWKGTEIQVENWDYGQLIGFIAGLRAPSDPSADNMTAGWCFGTCFPYIGKIFIPTDELHHFSEGWRKTTNQVEIPRMDLDRDLSLNQRYPSSFHGQASVVCGEETAA